MKTLKLLTQNCLVALVALGVSTTAVLAQAPVEDLTQQSQENAQSGGGFEVREVGPETNSSNTNSTVSQNYNVPPMPPVASTRGLAPNQRIDRLEQQINNLVQMNLVGKIDALEQQIQQLQGKLEEQAHELKTLNEQQRKFYEDLDQRLSQKTSSASSVSKIAEQSSEKNVDDTAKTNVSRIASEKNTVASSNANEEELYKKGFSALKAKKYDQAATVFRNYNNQFPNGKFAANSHYWLGEVYYLQGANQKAAVEFNKVTAQYPTSDKVTNALLKTAFIHANLGKTAQAKQELLKIKKQFPGSTAARLAEMRLKELGN